MPCATLSSSPLFFGRIAMESVGFGYSTPSSVTLRVGAHSVSPVFAPESFSTAPMSPAQMAPMSSCFLPRMSTTLPMRSVLPVRMFTSCESCATLPEITFRYETLPTKRSAIVLNTMAAVAPSG